MKIFKIVLILLGIIVLFCICLIPFDLKEQNEIKNMIINEVNLNELEDGQYTGSFKKHRWEYSVKVDIENHKIKKISFDSQNSLNNYSEKIINRIIEEQKINVDATSGATINAKILLKAVEDALVK